MYVLRLGSITERWIRLGLLYIRVSDTYKCSGKQTQMQYFNKHNNYPIGSKHRSDNAYTHKKHLLILHQLNCNAPKHPRLIDILAILCTLATYESHRLSVPITHQVKGDATRKYQSELRELNKSVTKIGGDNIVRPECDGFTV